MHWLITSALTQLEAASFGSTRRGDATNSHTRAVGFRSTSHSLPGFHSQTFTACWQGGRKVVPRMARYTREEAALAGSIGGHISWANTVDRSARTRPGREALEARFLREADGDPVRAEHLRKAHYRRLALKSAIARRMSDGYCVTDWDRHQSLAGDVEWQRERNRRKVAAYRERERAKADQPGPATGYDIGHVTDYPGGEERRGGTST
jgi:hypothetical protein